MFAPKAFLKLMTVLLTRKMLHFLFETWLCDVCLQAIEAEVNVFYPELTARDSSLNLLANQLRRLQVGKSLPFGVGLRAETQLIIVT